MDKKSNKKAFLADIRGLINPEGNKGVMEIEKSVIVKLIADCKINPLPPQGNGNLNRWYKVNTVAEYDILLLEVTPDNYKIVEGGQIGAVLQRFHWGYDGKNVVNCSAVKDKRITLEKMILNMDRYYFFNPNDLKWDAHHMYLRSVALQSTLKALSRTDHIKGHMSFGNYDRAQCVKINSVDEFVYFISILIKNVNILKTKKFSLEY